jgi:hypothetical protein
MLTAAVAPVLTLPTDSEFAGPFNPVNPRGSEKLNLAAKAVPMFVTLAV